MATGGVAIALLILVAIQTLWPIAKAAYIVAHTNYQVTFIPNIRYEQEYLAEADLAKAKAEYHLPNTDPDAVGDIKIEHDGTGYYLVFINNRNFSQPDARKYAKLVSLPSKDLNILVRVQPNGPKVKEPKKQRETFDI